MLHVREFNTADALMAHYKELNARKSAGFRHITSGAPLKRKCRGVELEQRNIHGFYGLQAYLRPIGPARVVWKRPAGMPEPKHEEPSTIKAQRILAEVAELHKLTIEAICGTCRTARFVHARQHAFFRLVEETGWSTPRIGRFVGGKDHTTVLHAVKAHLKRMANREQGK